MSVSTTTTNYGLPIFAGTDHGNWFDFNTGFQAIDTAIKAAAQAAESAQTEAAAATKLANSASSLAGSTNTNLTNLSNSIDNWETSVPYNSLTNKIESINDGLLYLNKKLNLLGFRFNCKGVSSQSLLNTDKFINLNLPKTLTLSSQRTIVNGCSINYLKTDNTNITYQAYMIINTDGTCQLTSVPTGIDWTKDWYIRANIMLWIGNWD